MAIGNHAPAPRTMSPFLHPGASAQAGSLAVLHLRRDHLIPVTLKEVSGEADGYAEGHVLNTRFGSFPHSTLVGQQWGNQVLASKVDTGSRGWKKGNKKRRLDDSRDVKEGSPTDVDSSDRRDAGQSAAKPQKHAVEASSGFGHILPPTPESWTTSLPHRTQVVYTPDYSHIIQKTQMRPGSILIEAGGGSGSFTHAAARAVFNGYPTASKKRKRTGRVFTFEYHEQRTEKLQAEFREHGLSSIVHVSKRDVYEGGFLVSSLAENSESEDVDAKSRETAAMQSPKATHVFLDLPAPWLALPHLTRSADPAFIPSNEQTVVPPPSPLDPQLPVHLCAFVPCLEQAQRTITCLRSYGWVEIEMQELHHRRMEVRRERQGLDLEGQRGARSEPRNVEEAIERLMQVDENAERWREEQLAANALLDQTNGDVSGQLNDQEEERKPARETRGERNERLKRENRHAKEWENGRIIVKCEPEIKNHTSYLVFAVLPRSWAEDA